MPFFYLSGEEIRAGDRIRYGGHSGEVDFIADPALDPDDWYVKEFGGGVMIRVPEAFGSVFLPGEAIAEDLEFVSKR